ncbi:MAG: J domain-containing protein [Alphaproteobacteria bacterium]|nr:J domain-containing protein [Alphaproteobacteria bacterium]MBN2675588.1 J domain-containing protein [Alphaproteobacteria bacterium]
MIKKCDHTGCDKAGTCRAPKSRDLKDYWFFCQDHASDYNKNWNFYSNMTPEEIEADWEKQTFGAPLKDKEKANKDSADYANFINDFLTGRSKFDNVTSKKSLPSKIISALKVLDLPITITWRDIGTKYRMLAKKYHPDTSKQKKNTSTEFAKINEAYKTLEIYYKK